MRIKLSILLTVFFSWIVAAMAQPQKVLILYSTGGHSTAAKSIEQQIQKNLPGVEVIRKDFAEELEGFPRWFHLKGYDLISKHAPWMSRIGTRTMWNESEQRALQVADRNHVKAGQPDRILQYIESVRPDVIISTHFNVSETLAAIRSQGQLQNTPIAWTHLDMVDNQFFRQLAEEMDMTFVPSSEMAAEWAKVIDPAKVRSSGMPIMENMSKPLDRSLAPQVRAQLGLREGDPTVLLLGGSMGALPYKKLIQALVKKVPKGQRLQILAVCGRNAEALAELKEWQNSPTFPHQRLSILAEGFVPLERVRELQLAATSVISKPGGLSSFELLATGVPVILTEGIGLQETYNARYIRDEHAGLYVEHIEDVPLSWSQVQSQPEKQKELVENQARLRKQFNLKAIVDWVKNPSILTNRNSPPRVLPLLKKASGVIRCEMVLTR